MTVFRFDGSFDGLLTGVFLAYSAKKRPECVVAPGGEMPLFSSDVVDVVTDVSKSERVWNALLHKVSRGAASAMATSFLCEDNAFYTSLFRFICRVFDSAENVESDFSDADLLAILENSRRVKGEAHRVVQFMRFQKAADGTYFGMMEPRYDVMHMAVEHFRDRFSDGKFIIYDRRRDYGYYYDGRRLERMRLSSDRSHMTTGILPDDMADADEQLFQKLWRTYFKYTAIPERINPRKQRQDMPVRFWKYLTEKNGL